MKMKNVKQKVANADEPDNLLSVLNVAPCCLASSRAALQSDAEHEAKDSITVPLETFRIDKYQKAIHLPVLLYRNLCSAL